jgi:hypothetical protein
VSARKDRAEIVAELERRLAMSEQLRTLAYENDLNGESIMLCRAALESVGIRAAFHDDCGRIAAFQISTLRLENEQLLAALPWWRRRKFTRGTR